MSIPGTVQLTGQVAPTALTDTYPTHADIYGLGGLRSVADVTARNAVTTDRSSLGMIVVTQSDFKLWQLTTYPPTGSNSDWTQFASGGASAGDFTQARLTLTSGVPVTTTDVIGATSIYWTPYKGNSVTLWDGSNWTTYALTEQSLALVALTAFMGYDVFAFQNSGVPNIEILPWLNGTVTFAAGTTVTWTGNAPPVGSPVTFTSSGTLPAAISPNVRYWVQAQTPPNTFSISTALNGGPITFATAGTGTHTAWNPRVRGTNVTIQDGRYCKSGDKTRRYVGSFETTSTTTTEDSRGATTTQVPGKRFLFNYYNPKECSAEVIDTTGFWTYTSNIVRQANATFGNRVDFFVGMPEDAYTFEARGAAGQASTTSTTTASNGVGINTNTAYDSHCRSHPGFQGSASSSENALTGKLIAVPPLGDCSAYWLEAGGNGTCNFLGGTANAANNSSGLLVEMYH